MRVFVTHCCAKKNNALKGTTNKVSPGELYTAAPTLRFIKKCTERGVEWAIFSDLYGIWLPSERHEWYEKNPSRVNEQEFAALVKDFDGKLAAFSEIWFYHNPGRFHKLYKRLLQESALKDKIKPFTHLNEIK